MNKLVLALASSSIALFSILISGQLTLAAETKGQMIDDSGLVITSNADGSLKESYLAKPDRVSLKALQTKNLSLGPVLSEILAFNVDAK